MDLDEDDFEEGVQKITVPGESITSSHAFMRYSHLALSPNSSRIHVTVQRPRDVRRRRRSHCISHGYGGTRKQAYYSARGTQQVCFLHTFGIAFLTYIAGTILRSAIW